MSDESILIVAGEASGDAHAARLVRELRALRPDLAFFGTGGDRLRNEGVELLFDISEMNVVGFWEVVRQYRRLRSIFRSVVTEAGRRRPRLAILVDYPGFNLRLAPQLKALGIPVVYYIAPQVWAWKEGRVRTLKESVDDLIVVFPFEVEYFRERGLSAHFFGHPLIDRFAEQGIGSGDVNVGGASKPVIAYLPGSRTQEITHHMPFVCDVIRTLGDSFTHIIQQAPTVAPEALESYRAAAEFTVTNEPYRALAQADAALVKSGTSTLEATLLDVPYIVFYKTSAVSYFIARRLVKVESTAMANILAGRKIVGEYIQSELDSRKVAEELRDLATEGPRGREVRRELAAITASLGEPGAAKKAARFIAETYL